MLAGDWQLLTSDLSLGVLGSYTDNLFIIVIIK